MAQAAALLHAFLAACAPPLLPALLLSLPSQALAKGRAARRVAKWRKMLGPGGATLRAFIEGRLLKFKRRVRKGIPDEFRGLAWHIMSGEPHAAHAPLYRTQHPGCQARRACSWALPERSIMTTTRPHTCHPYIYLYSHTCICLPPVTGHVEHARCPPGCLPAGGRELLQANPGEFARLQEAVLPEYDTIIGRDLDRTFPNHILFMQRQGVGQHALFTVLRAYTAYDARVRRAARTCMDAPLHHDTFRPLSFFARLA